MSAPDHSSLPLPDYDHLPVAAGPMKGVTTAQPGSGIRVPLLRQAWRRVTFVHWRYPGPLLQRLMPSGLTGVAAPFQGLVLRRR